MFYWSARAQATLVCNAASQVRARVFNTNQPEGLLWNHVFTMSRHFTYFANVSRKIAAPSKGKIVGSQKKIARARRLKEIVWTSRRSDAGGRRWETNARNIVYAYTRGARKRQHMGEKYKYSFSSFKAVVSRVLYYWWSFIDEARSSVPAFASFIGLSVFSAALRVILLCELHYWAAHIYVASHLSCTCRVGDRAIKEQRGQK